MKATWSMLLSTKKLVLYSFVLLMGHCKDTYDNTRAAADLQVPAFTETGADTFGCLVNGKAWANFGGEYETQLGIGSVVPNKVKMFTTLDSGIYYTSITARLTVSATGKVIREEGMELKVPFDTLYKTGVRLLNQKDGLLTYYDYTRNINYTSLKRNPMTVDVLKAGIADVQGNLASTIVSGKFDGMLYNHDQTDSLRIVGGVFDVLN